MAIYFQLIPRVDPEHGPMSMQDIDAGICQYLNTTLSDKKWCCWWYDAIGYWLASGYSFERIRRMHIEYALKGRRDDEHGYRDEEIALNLLIIAQWLDDNYIVINWAGR